LSWLEARPGSARRGVDCGLARLGPAWPGRARLGEDKKGGATLPPQSERL